MARVSIDFGTANTVLARYSESTGKAESVVIPGISTELGYRLSPDEPERTVSLIPSMIHYSETETLVGDQVLSRGLAEHRDTFRWMKRSLAQGVTKRKKTAQGFKSYRDAGTEFLSLVLRYVSDQLSFEEDEFTFTIPVEAFEDFQDWLRDVAEGLGLRRVRFMDEATACVTGMQGACRQDDRFLVLDFGCGTLDVSAVRIDVAARSDRKAIQLGKAGCDLGGMDIDQWLAQDFCRRHGIEGQDRREVEALVERRAEAVKIALSDPRETEATLTLPMTQGSRARVFSTSYRCSCGSCRQGKVDGHADADQGCLGCLLMAGRPPEDKNFIEQVRDTMDRALENAAVNAGMRKRDLKRVLVTGGTSLVSVVQQLLQETFGGKLAREQPFDAVARGGCQGLVAPILQHDYAIESYSRERKRYEFKPFLKQGTEYPTDKDVIRFWAKGAYENQTAIGVRIFEVSQVRRKALDEALMDESGSLRGGSKVETDLDYIELTGRNPTFIVADPPVSLDRDKKRFFCTFWVDGNRTLRVTVADHRYNHPRTLLLDHPVVRL